MLGVGNIYLRLHSLPERMAHKSQKLQFEIVAVLGLISLFTHIHIFWIAGLLLALIDLPDFSHAAGPYRRIGREDRGFRGCRQPARLRMQATAAQAAPASDQAAPTHAKQTSAPAKEVGSHV